jgi:Golgi phosphoprotein 3 (GPP34)
MRVGSLRDDVFLLAHDDSGRLIGAEPSISAGLAGATLIDLLLHGRVAVVDGRLDVIDSASTGDDEADATLMAIAANEAPTGPRAWVSWISDRAYERTAKSLDAAGVIRRTTARRLGLVTVTRCLPADPDDLVRLRSRLRYAVHSKDLPDAPTAALCGLVRVLRLQSSLLLSMPSSELLLALERMAGANATTVRQVTNAVEAVITAATYR